MCRYAEYKYCPVDMALLDLSCQWQDFSTSGFYKAFLKKYPETINAVHCGFTKAFMEVNFEKKKKKEQSTPLFQVSC